MRVNFASPNPSGEVLVKFICLDLGVLVVPVCYSLGPVVYSSDLPSRSTHLPCLAKI
jgi:hypothetical protein